ncbi:MAG: DUF1572 family protein [Saprospiraceae bacterium]
MDADFLKSAIAQFKVYKNLGEKTFAQLNDTQIAWKYNEESNSIVIIVNHLHGNMNSRWTDFLTTDGEKEWRKRDQEFENKLLDKSELIKIWEEGWKCLFDTLESLNNSDLNKTVLIRNQKLSVLDAILRQLAHYSYHVGQIVFIGKMICYDGWESLSIPKGKSQNYNDTLSFKKE